MTNLREAGDPFQINTRGLRPLDDAVDPATGRIRVMPAAFWADTSPEERAWFGHRHGAYLLPTVELVDCLRELIADRPAIEIAAGNGVLAAALGIRATDSHQQSQPRFRAYYASIGQPTVPYGPNVAPLDARNAVGRYRPQVVIGAWVTWRPDPDLPHIGGNIAGVDEAAILARVDTYVHIGNDHLHRHKPLIQRPHHIERPPWLFSRASNGTPDHIAIWNREAPV